MTLSEDDAITASIAALTATTIERKCREYYLRGQINGVVLGATLSVIAGFAMGLFVGLVL